MPKKEVIDALMEINTRCTDLDACCDDGCEYERICDDYFAYTLPMDWDLTEKNDN